MEICTLRINTNFDEVEKQLNRIIDKLEKANDLLEKADKFKANRKQPDRRGKMDLKKVTYFYKGFEVEIEPSEPKGKFSYTIYYGNGEEHWSIGYKSEQKAKEKAKEYIDNLKQEEIKKQAEEVLNGIIEKVKEDSVTELSIDITNGTIDKPNYQTGYIETMYDGTMSITINLYDEKADKSK